MSESGPGVNNHFTIRTAVPHVFAGVREEGYDATKQPASDQKYYTGNQPRERA